MALRYTWLIQSDQRIKKKKSQTEKEALLDGTGERELLTRVRSHLA